MSGISEDKLLAWGRDVELGPADFEGWPASLVPTLLKEIRRLRAENKELRASYERVEKYGQSLRAENQGMNSKLDRLADKGLCQGCEPVCRNCSQDECDLAKERTPLP